MTLFRTLLWWLLLAAAGALAYELLSPDLGEVLVRWHRRTLTTTVAFALVAWALLWLAAWMLWTLLRMPFTAWQRLAQTQARNRLVNGFTALHEGRFERAASLLDKAAEEPGVAAVARLAAREAALARGDLEAAAVQQAALSRDFPMAAALVSANALLAQSRPAQALEVLQPWVERKQLPPRGLRLRGEALVSFGRAEDAVALLPELAAAQSLSSEQMQALERDWQAAALRQCAHANQLHQRWQQLSAPLRQAPELLLAFAIRAGEQGLEAEAANVLADAIERQWHDALVHRFGLLPPAREDLRLPRAQRWLAEHPDSAAMALCLARLCMGAGQFSQAEDLLHRALAQGAGSEAWEELGHVFTARNDAPRAQASYANALRSGRGQAPHSLDGRSLREQIADEAVAERRDEHGLPHLRS